MSLQTHRLFHIAKKAIPDSLKAVVATLYGDFNSLKTTGSLDSITSVEIETTTECNRRCSHCPNSTYTRSNYLMEESLFRKIIDELSETGFNGKIFPHFYGEPLMDNRMPDLIAYSKSRLPASRLILHTNADKLDEVVLKVLIEAGMDKMVITGYNSSISEGALGIIENPDYGRFVMSSSIKEHRLFNRGGLVAIPEERRAIPSPCYVAPHTIVIMYDGNVPICCNDYLGSAVFGNISERPLMDVWNGADY